MAKEKTLGENRVRTDFNPAKTDLVSSIKQKSAELIDLVNSIEATTSEGKRLKSLAMTVYENGAMWGVKAATIDK